MRSIVVLVLCVFGVWPTTSLFVPMKENKDVQAINYDPQKILQHMTPCVSMSVMVILAQKNSTDATLMPEEAEEIIVDCLARYNFSHFILFHHIEKIADLNETFSPCVADWNRRTTMLKRMEIVDEGGDYCKFLTDKLNSWFCDVRYVCGATMDADLIYSVGYVMQQYAAKTDQPLSCPKLPENSELLGQVVNPIAYTPEFDVHRDKLLVADICTLPNGRQHVPPHSAKEVNSSTTAASNTAEPEPPRPSIPRFIRLPIGDGKRQFKEPQSTRI